MVKQAKYLYTILLFVICTIYANAQESILWKITKPENPEASYVLCTSDLSGAENYDIITPIAPVMDMVNTVGFFYIPDASDKQNIPTLMGAEDEKTLKGFYKRDDRIRFELMVRDKLNADVENLYTLKPLYIMQLFKEKDHKNGAGFMQNALFDLSLQKTKPTLSLLTLRQIGTAMDGIDFETQAFILSNYMATVTNYLETDTKKFQFYKNQQLSEFAKEFYALEQDAYLETYINNINELIIKKIEVLSPQQSVLYITDAEFAAGEAGLLTKLKNRGYTVSAQPVSLLQRDISKPIDQVIVTNQNSYTPPDNFPDIVTSVSNNVIIDPSDITIIQSEDVSASLANKKYLAWTDPFNDMFDYVSADTLFLESWYDMKGTDANFKIKVPIKGEWEASVEDNILGTIKQYIYQTNHARTDLFYSIGYTVYPPTFSSPDKNSFYNDFLERSVNNIGGKPVAQRIISTPYFTGREFTAVVGDSFFVRSVFFLQDNILYQMLVGGPGNNAYTAYAEAFLSSFKTTGASISNWYLFEQPSFKCYLPTPPSRTTQSYNVGGGAMNQITYTAEDYKENISYIISVYNYPPGYNFKNKNAFYEELISAAERQYFGQSQSVTKVTKNGIEGRYVVMPLMNKKTYRMYFFFDKTAVYQYIAGGDPATIQSLNVQRFFDSFLFEGEGTQE